MRPGVTESPLLRGRRAREDASRALRKSRFDDVLHQKRRARIAQYTIDTPLMDGDDAPLRQLMELVVSSSDDERLLPALTRLRRAVDTEEGDELSALIASDDMMMWLVNVVKDTSRATRLRFESAWLLTNVASTRHTQIVVSVDGVAPFIAPAYESDPDLVEQCVWCIGNIAGDNDALRDRALEEGALDAVLHVVTQPPSPSALRTAVWALTNLVHKRTTTHMIGDASHAIRLRVAPVFAQIIVRCTNEVQDDTMLADALAGCAFVTDICEDDDVHATVLLALEPCMQHIRRDDARLSVQALRVVGNLIAGNHVHTQCVLDAGALHVLSQLVDSDNRTTRKETVWALSNLVAGTPHQLREVMVRAPLVARIIDRLATDEMSVRRECAYFVVNVTENGTYDDTRRLIQANLFAAVASALSQTNMHVVTMGVLLAALTRILSLARGNGNLDETVDALESSGCADIVRALQLHNARAIVNKADAIVDTFLEGGDDECVNENDVYELYS